MKTKSFIFVTLFLVIFATASGLIISTLQSQKAFIEFKKGDSYAEAWKKVTQFESSGLPKSASELVDQIYKTAKSENNHAQIVKSIMYKIKYVIQTEDQGNVKIIVQIKNECDSAKYPVKPVLQSLLADFFWQYYSQNRYTILQRTNTSGFRPDDIATWDAKR